MNDNLKNMHMKNILITILLLLISSLHLLYGQGWLKDYGRENANRFVSVIETDDNGLLAFGQSQNPNSSTDIYELFLLKTDIDGNEQWSKYYWVGTNDLYASSILLTDDGGILMLGLLVNIVNQNKEVYLLKTDMNGVKVWSHRFDYGGDTKNPYKIIQTTDGGFLLANTQGDNDIWYGKISSLGVEEWNYTISSSGGSNQYPPDIEALSDGYLLSGENKLVKLDLSGEEVWEKTIEEDYKIVNMRSVSDGNFMLLTSTRFVHKLSKRSPTGDEIWNILIDIGSLSSNAEIVETDDGGFIVPKVRTALPIGSEPPTYITGIIKTNSLGEEEWQKDIGPKGLFTFFFMKDSSEKLIYAGTNVYDNAGTFPKNAFLMKTDTQGILYSNHIQGTVFSDDNQNCTFEEGTEDGISSRIVQAIGHKTFYGTTDEMGNYEINVDTGIYEVNFILPNPYWATCGPQIVNISEFYTDTIVDLANQAVINCPWLTVDISTPFLRRCFDNNYTINYCNQGTIDAEDAYIEVSFDPFLEVQSSSLPWSSQTGNTYTFNVDTLDVGECGSFNVTTYVNCDSTILGQTHCSTAHIYPDSICLPDAANWDGSSVEVEAACDGDSVRFLIRNVGDGNMQEALEYIIIEDELMVHQGNFQLNAGQSQMLSNGYSSNGSTYRIIAQQSLGHPGNSIPTAAIEGCGTSWFSVGFFNMFSQDDGDFFLSTDCQENIGSYDPNDKQGFPKGYGAEHYIWQNVDLEYLIRFQNTGTDTAFTVVIRDTISEHLDITSLQMGASSHAYTYTIDGEGVLKVRFDNILLPDSTTNELASHGFFKYKIKQQPDLPIGTMIYNKAAIYFDFNAPIITNETLHEVAEPFISTLVTTDDLTTNNIKLHVFPNPFGAFTTFEIDNLPAGRTDFLLYDNLGRLVRKERVLDTERFQFYRKALASGLYFFEFQQSGVRVASGKMLAE